MRSFLSADREGQRNERRIERTWCAVVLVLVIAGMIIPTGFAEAGAVTTLINTLLVVIAKVLEWIIFFIGRLVILIVDVVIQVAQYNHFVDSAPVRNGWPLVRDVTNMFFIVILLIVAFGTIVQYEKLHYRKILPKLLLMAVLVNFSLTLIGLLIDFSQVLMLTFVNGFKAAAGGNFVEALKLNQVMKLTSEQAEIKAQMGSDTPSDPFIVKIVIAEMLAIFFLGITITMLLIMLVYLLARIVGLWIALILSPLALFATALPEFLAKKISRVADGYWKKLGALLSGGPMMAFFLWLTLATVQGEGFGGFTDKDAAQQAEVAGVLTKQSGFATAIANVEDVATFFVAIIMLLMGVKAAVEVTDVISPKAAAIGGKIRDVGVKGAKFAAYGGMMMAGAGAARGAAYAARGAYRAGRYGAGAVGGAAGRGIDRRVDITGRGGRFMQRAGATLGSTALMGAGARMAGVRPGARREMGAKMEKGLANLPMGQRLGQLEKLSKSRNVDRAQAAQLQLTKLASTPDGIGAKSKQFEEEAAAKGIPEGKERKAYAEVRARQYTGQQLSELEARSRETHDEDSLKTVRDRIEQRPDLIQDDGKFHDRMTSMADDGVREMKKKIKSPAYQDSRVWDSLFRSTDALNADGTENKESGFNKELLNAGGTAGIIGQQRLAELQEASEKTKHKGNVKAFLEDEEAFATSGLAGTFYARAGAGKYEAVNKADIKIEPEVAKTGKAPRVERRAGEISAGQQRVADRRAALAQHRRDRGMSPSEHDDTTRAAHSEMGRSQFAVMQAGGSLQEATGADAQGTFTTQDDSRAFGMAVTQMHQAGNTDVKVYNNMDVDALNANPGQVNEARSTFVQNTNVDQVKKSYERAQKSGDTRTLQSVANMAKAIDTEGSHVQKMISGQNKATDKYNKGAVGAGRSPRDRVNTADVIEAAKKNDQGALKSALGDSGLVMDMNDAKALMKREAVKSDAVLRSYTKHASSRAKSSLRRAASREGRAGRQERKWERGAAAAGEGGGPDIEPPRAGGAPRRTPDETPPPRPQPRAGGAPPRPETPGYGERDIGDTGGATPDIDV